MRPALLVLFALSACRTGSLDEGFDAAGPVIADDAIYDAHPLITNLGRIGIFKRSMSRGVCAWIVLAQGPNLMEHWTTPFGWQEESASINTEAANCFTLMPFGSKFWPAEGAGTVEFTKQGVAGDFPCSISVHATLAADKTANGVQKPVEIAVNERFDADNLIVDGDTCGLF